MQIQVDEHVFEIDDDQAHLAALPWIVRKDKGRPQHGPYAHCGRRWLHREVMGLGGVPASVVLVDHIDGNTLDCRRSNLRCATPSQNQHNAKRRVDNASGVKGVSWCKTYQKWEAYIKVNGKQRKLGRFTELEDARKAREAAAESLHGRFARH